MIRIASWNVNGIRAAQNKGFLDWLERASPDFLCVQETKAEPGQLSDEMKAPSDKNGKPYHSYWSSAKKRGYSGTAIYSLTEPLSVKPLGIAEFDDEGRTTIADYGKFTLISAYFPNSQDGGARLDYKLRFCDTMLKLSNKLRKAGRNFVLCGDYNIAHTPIDIARPKENEGNAGYLPEEREWMTKYLSAGYIDTFRYLHPGESEHYTWWSYRANARARNVGWRLDYECINPELLPAMKDAAILHEVEGSDHCPVTLDLDL
jgi:exodeoxyribonuclease-3